MIVYDRLHRKKTKTIEERLAILEKEFKKFKDCTPRYGIIVTQNQPTFFPREMRY